MSEREEPSRGGIPVGDLMSKLAVDPEYQRKMQAAEEDRQARNHQLRRARQPIVDNLRNAASSPPSTPSTPATAADPTPESITLETFGREIPEA